MVRKEWAKNFERNKSAYRNFLAKFLENPVFDSPSIHDALQSSYNVTLKTKRPLRATASVFVAELILKNKDKVLNDLETLRAHPKSVFEPFAGDDAPDTSFHKISNSPAKSTATTRKRKSDDDGSANAVCKKSRVSASASRKDIKCLSSKWKVKYTDEKRSRKKKKAVIVVKDLKNFLKLERKKSLPYLEECKIPVVVLESNEALEEMAKKLKTKRSRGRKPRESGAIGKANAGRGKNNGQIVHKDSQTCSAKDHGRDNEVWTGIENSVFIKPEINLIDTTAQLDAAQPLPQGDYNAIDAYNDNYDVNLYEGDHRQIDAESQLSQMSQLPQNALNSSGTVIFHNDIENPSAFDAPYCNGIIALDEQYTVCAHGNLNNCAPAPALPLSQLNPGIALVNSKDFHDNYEITQNNRVNLSDYFHGARLPAHNNFQLKPEEAYANHPPAFDPAEEIARLRTAIFHLSAKVSSLENLVNQSYLRHFSENL